MSVIEAQTDSPEGFRNRLLNFDKDGHRSKIYPQKPKGKFYNYRTILSWFLLAFLFGAPFVKVYGHQFMLFNILERKFVLFGVVFMPQDLYLVALAMMTVIISIFLFTAILGRIWCGWLCPQTIFLEMLYRKIEYLIEGDGIRQRLFDQAPMSANKFIRKAIKHIIFFALAFAIGNTFLAYIIGSDELIKIITDPPSQHVAGLAVMVFFSLVFYAVFARFREQACVIVCPYGRYQSVMIDVDTVLVSYDFKRGEPRGKFTKQDKEAQAQGLSGAANKGDCIDCHKCVDVCPTNVDIRNGIQLECVNCTACIDACDEVMEKVKKPKGLIRYTSLSTIRDGARHWLSNTVKAYMIVWTIITSVFCYLYIARPMTEVVLLRAPGMLSTNDAQGNKINFYVLDIVNKHYHDVKIDVKLVSPTNGKVQLIGDLSKVREVSEKSARIMLTLPKENLTMADLPVRFAVYANNEFVKEVETKFLTVK